MIREEVWKAALAGLLHDIGKFAQRAGVEVREEWRDPQTKADFGYQHALHTYRFVDQYLPAAIKDELKVLAAYHHRPKGRGNVIQLADHLAAGERRKQEGDDSDRKAHPRQLHPVFIGIRADGQEHPYKGQDRFYFPLQPLALEESVIFPAVEPLKEQEAWQAYEKLWNAFCREAEQLKSQYEQSQAWESYVESMLSLMQRYTWCIPAAYFKAIPDVSLYDHSRMTAALAACLAEFDDVTLERIAQTPEQSEAPVALLVGGDISGVQDFIYTISSKGAAKMLRGRSFYLQLLTEAVLRFVLRRLALPYTNVIYAGGGHFYLLAPPSVEKEIPTIQAEIAKHLLAQHHTQLVLVLQSIPLTADHFQAGKLSEAWQTLNQKLSIAKNRRYGELADVFYQEIFEVPEFGGNPNATCSVCGDERRGAQEWDEWEAQSKICPLCRSFAETIGRELPNTRFLALKFSDDESVYTISQTALGILARFGMDVEFLSSPSQTVEVTQGQTLVLWALENPPQGQWPSATQTAVRWLRYTPHRVPPLTFDELQKKCSSGFERLGVLRMDVDNLGTVFKDGLGQAFSLSRMATLSFQISLFFEGWLKRIVERTEWQDLVYTVYSGGDDLFLIAPWEKVPAIAQKIVEDFYRYTAHAGLHLSGGMAFIDGKYPIYEAAQDAAEAEELAKKAGKNAFGFLNRAWNWKTFRELSQRKDALKELVQGETDEAQAGPRSILQVLRTLAIMEEEAIQIKGRPVWGRWMWLGAYQLKRLEERQKNKPELKQKIAALHKEIEPFQNLDIWGAAARWAMLETRKK
ncbi:MAG: type III-A CRISPR-associated protein Cas10/Csm1 [Anaerolineae bacterium]|jgi:CRISPR-associated protein Csm1|nr:MAG: type III-A CRISPR-associated protein Cas10/Csm1 [Anaerolineae bacterium]